jgi:hypothetical protein
LRAGKAYISSLGTTGLLVASSVILLVVVGALIAFDAWPTGASAGRTENVALGATQRAAAVKAAKAHSTGTASRVTLRAGARATGRATARTARKAGKTVTRDGGRPVNDESPLVSGLPHPTTDSNADSGGHALPPAGAPAAGSGSGLPLPTSSAGSAVSTGRETTTQVADAVAGISPQAGALVNGVGDTVDNVVGQILPSANAQSAP